MVGYLYCNQFEELNNKIATGEISPKEFTNEVRRHPSMLPTTALSARRLMEDFSISNERAQVSSSYFRHIQQIDFIGD